MPVEKDLGAKAAAYVGHRSSAARARRAGAVFGGRGGGARGGPSRVQGHGATESVGPVRSDPSDGLDHGAAGREPAPGDAAHLPTGCGARAGAAARRVGGLGLAIQRKLRWRAPAPARAVFRAVFARRAQRKGWGCLGGRA